MSGFKRDDSIDSAGFRGIIPDNTTVAALIVDTDAVRIKLKTGNNAGRTATIYNPVFEVLHGKYKGARIYSSIWCNVEADPAGGDPKVFGSHQLFCDLSDITNVYDEDGSSYLVASTEEEAKKIALRFTSKLAIVTVSIENFEKKDGTPGSKNSVKALSKPNEEMVSKLADVIVVVEEKVAKWKAKKAAEAGATGFETPEDNSQEDDDEDLPF